MIIINEVNWKVVKRTNIIGSNYKSRIDMINNDDIILVYVKRPISSIMGKFSVVANFVNHKHMFSGGIYTFRLELKPIKILKNPIKIMSLIDKLGFIKNYCCTNRIYNNF